MRLMVRRYAKKYKLRAIVRRFGKKYKPQGFGRTLIRQTS